MARLVVTDGALRLLICYPLGAVVEATGMWLGPRWGPPAMGVRGVQLVVVDLAEPCRVGGELVPAGVVLAVDPRVVVARLDTLEVLYHPRMPSVELAPPFATEMAPSWPDVALAKIDRARRRRLQRAPRRRRRRR